MIQFKIKGIKLADVSTGKEKQKCSNTLKAAELYTHTHTHTHTQLKRCLAFLFSAVLFVSSAFSTILPSGYTELEYIENQGDSFIDTGIKPNSNTEIEAKFSLNSVDNYQCLIGGRIRYEAQNKNKDSFTIWANPNSNQIRFDYGDDIKNSNINVSVNTLYVVTKAKERNYVNGIETDSNTVSTFTCDYNLFLFGVNTFGDMPIPYYMDGKVYYVKIWDNGTLVRNFVPVKRKSDNIVGLYDLVGDTFYTNSGTGDFIAGPAVCATTVTILGAQFCLTENQPSGSYLTARYNNNKYYINLSVENDALNPKAITSESNNVLRIKVGNTTYNAHDTSVLE